MLSSGVPWHAFSNSTTVSSAQASGTVAIPADAAGNTTGIQRRLILTMLSGGAHIRFPIGTTVGTAVTNDYLIAGTPKFINVPGGATVLAHICANAVTSILNIAVAEA